ncbi:aspartyl-phosphate phosphatase Spo0E family protein [Orenia metallireducens]|uniref:aspartyl-phosphate phosphatase Spo0E family protein n=1 Tax=Orenia metallireducens TaxID=1413210 RepID=UPI00159EFA50|nr:aspartyl-phosphate phosphatase Spo0E family protein [Orenia metallireducens]
MDYSSKNLKEELEDFRQKLQVLSSKSERLTAKELIKLSQKLDRLIMKFYNKNS